MLRFSLLLAALLLFAGCATNVPPAAAPQALALDAAFTPSGTPIPPTPTPTGTSTITGTPTRVATTRVPPSPSPTRVPATPTRVPATATPTRYPVTLMPTEIERRPTSDLTVLLPDLRMLPPADLTIEITPEGQRLFRLTNYIINWGRGKLEVLGTSDRLSERTVVTQHVYRANGTYTARPAGMFFFHIAHNHWHFENFAVYALWSLTPQGELNESVAVMDKVSYCLRDTGRSELPYAALNQLYTECEADLQGINAGWIDSYEYDLPGQTIDITALPDGIYALVCTVDPGDRLLELDETNNSALIYVQLQGDTVTEIDRAQMLQALAQ